MNITRRLFAFVLVLTAPLLAFSAGQSSLGLGGKRQFLTYIGTYTSKTNSKGIYAYKFDADSAKLTPLGVAVETQDPSFLAVHPGGQSLYAVNEIDNFKGEKSGALSAYSINHKSGKLTLLNQVATRGAGPCYISLDKTGKSILVANYDGGSVATFRVQDDGGVGAAGSFVQHTGTGPNKERQEGPHAHWMETSPDNRYALAVDLGLDKILIYRFDADQGTLTPSDPPFVKVNPGAGPRHFAFHPEGVFAYVLSEIQSTVTTFRYDQKTGALTPIQTLSTLPKDFAGHNDTAEIVVHGSGQFLYVSNRGHDSIAVFSVNPATGQLALSKFFSTKGKTPRHFAIDPTGNFLLAANQESNNIVIFRIDPISGNLTQVGQAVDVPAPVDITFAALE